MLLEGDAEEGKHFDFDDSDDVGPETSQLTAATSGGGNRKQPGSDVHETTKADVNRAAGRLMGKHSLLLPV